MKTIFKNTAILQQNVAKNENNFQNERNFHSVGENSGGGKGNPERRILNGQATRAETIRG